MRITLQMVVLVLAAALSSCDKGDKKENPQLGTDLVRFQWKPLSDEPDSNATAQIKVLNQFNEPIAGAQILIGMAQGNPFRQNFLTTNAKGIANFGAEWNKPAHLTVDAPGFVRQTLLNQKPGQITLKLNPAYLPQRAVVQGQITQLPVQNGDKLIDFGLVMPALTRSDIMNFDLDQVISPYTDILSVAGQKAPLPSNVSLPTQKESYIFNLTVSKPLYRLMTPTLGPKRIYAARGRFPFKPVVEELRDNAPFYEILKYFTILGGSLRDVQVVNAQTNLDIPGTELEFKNSVQVQGAPILADEVQMLLSASEMAGTFVTTDVKKVDSNQSLQLTAMTDKPVYIVSAIKRKAEFMSNTPGSDRVSASLRPFKSGEAQSLLALVANPSVTNGSSLLIRFPAAPRKSSIQELAVSAIVSDLTTVTDGENQISVPHHRWEILGLGWSPEIQLPEWPLANTSAKRKVEINFIGSTSQKSVNLDDTLIEAATHVSHASTEF